VGDIVLGFVMESPEPISIGKSTQELQIVDFTSCGTELDLDAGSSSRSGQGKAVASISSWHSRASSGQEVSLDITRKLDEPGWDASCEFRGDEVGSCIGVGDGNGEDGGWKCFEESCAGLRATKE
jgi:hypothetical protein